MFSKLDGLTRFLAPLLPAPLFAGDTVSAAVTAGRQRLFRHPGRPSPKGDLPLADWVVARAGVRARSLLAVVEEPTAGDY